MASPRKKVEPAASRVAARPQAAERRVDTLADAGTVPSYDDVSRRAFQLWESSGRPAGRDLEHWLQAEAELRSGR
jgi:hypothetical protein